MMKRLLFAALAAVSLSLPAHAQLDELTIMAPAAPGGGWDQTARSMQQALTEAGLVGNVQVTNVPGRRRHDRPRAVRQQQAGNAKSLIVGGYVMVGAIITNQSPVTLADVTPIARLTGEYEGDRRAGRLRHQDDRRPRREAEGRSGRGQLGRRLGRRRRPHRGRADRQGGRRRSDQDQLHRLLGRRRGAGRDPRRPGHGRHLRLRRVEGADRGRRASPACGDARPSGSKASMRRRSRRAGSTSRRRTGAWSPRAPGISDADKTTLVDTSRRWSNPIRGRRRRRRRAGQNTFLAGDEFET